MSPQVKLFFLLLYKIKPYLGKSVGKDQSTNDLKCFFETPPLDKKRKKDGPSPMKRGILEAGS
jgi:hypothetical protein